MRHRTASSTSSTRTSSTRLTRLRDLLARYPDVHDGFERLAMVYEARGDRKQAAEYYRKALAFMRENADNYDSEAIDWMREQTGSIDFVVDRRIQ